MKAERPRRSQKSEARSARSRQKGAPRGKAARRNSAIEAHRVNGRSPSLHQAGDKPVAAPQAGARRGAKGSAKAGPLKHVTSVFDLSPGDVEDILAISADLKGRLRKGDRPPLLQGRVLTLVFEKPSLRTRNSFEAAAIQLGGGSVFLSTHDAGLNGRESLHDVARVLSSYSDAIVMRTFRQSLIEEFARQSQCPVVNGLSDDLHPCQALTDLFTIHETFGHLAGLRIVYIGDGNNVAASLAMAAAYAKMPITFCSPRGYELPETILRDLKRRIPQADIELIDDPVRAVKHADVVYTDVWASMGQESQAAQRQAVFATYQVNGDLMAAAPKSARFMHDLPAKRGLEVTDDVMDGPQSIVFQQAENRMHLAKGLLVWLLGADHAK